MIHGAYLRWLPRLFRVSHWDFILMAVLPSVGLTWDRIARFIRGFRVMFCPRCDARLWCHILTHVVLPPYRGNDLPLADVVSHLCQGKTDLCQSYFYRRSDENFRFAAFAIFSRLKGSFSRVAMCRLTASTYWINVLGRNSAVKSERPSH
jgi:hypothetical protein